MPTFFKRLASSVVFVAIMLTGLLWNEWSLLALVCLINFLCLREFFRLMQKVDKDNHWPWCIPVAIQVAGFILLLFSFMKIIHAATPADPNALLVVFFIIFVAVFMLVAVLSTPPAWKAGLQSLFGMVYISVPMSLLISLSGFHYLPLFIILMIWTNDTMAYLVGSFIGKTPFSPISPKKTWEGVIGGTVLTICVAILIGHFFSGNGALPQGIDNWIGYALCSLIVSVAGPLGDLFKSKFKRIADVKDSGNLMPGHGGALDRFDSLLMVVPFIYCMIAIAGFLARG